METAGVSMGPLRAQVGLCVVVVLLLNGSTGLVCYTAVESLDLGCLLRWDCPYASPNTTYTVQTKTQGDPWQDVPWCVWVSSRSCDVSQAFSHYELYNMIRLGVHLSPSSTVWMKPRKFDYSDLITFSSCLLSLQPPSVSVSVEDEQLLVKVQFPCAANRRCSMERCCAISELIDPWTTVTVYNQLNRSEHQSRTVWTQAVVSFVEFPGLSPGQNYCAVANFSFPTFSMAASPKSVPRCVQIVSKSGLLPVLGLGVVLVSLLVVPLLVVFLKKPGQAAPAAETQPKTQPKTPAPLHDPVSLVPLSLVPVDPRDIHLELHDDHVSVESASSLDSDQDETSALENACDSLHHDSSSGAVYWDSGGTDLETEMEMRRARDSGISIPHVSHSSEETGATNGD